MMRPMSDSNEQQPMNADEVVTEGEPRQPGPPAGSPIKIERFPDGLTIEIPPAGLWRGSQGLFFFAVLWNGIIGIITFCLLGAILGGDAKDNSIWALPAFLSIFWLVGIGILLAALNMGLRKAAIAVTGGTLMVIQKSIFGSKQRDWEKGDVEAVRAGPSGMTVNDRPVLELQIFDGGAAKFGMLCGRTDEELHWLAEELRVALGIPSQAS
jgi:hypothetical protein